MTFPATVAALLLLLASHPASAQTADRIWLGGLQALSANLLAPGSCQSEVMLRRTDAMVRGTAP